MRNALILIILLIPCLLIAQKKEWGLVISPAFSKARKAYGYAVVYPGAPLWAGNLKVEEQTVLGFSAEIFREKVSRIRRVSVQSGLGFLTCGSYQHFDYDYANSVNNIVSIESRFHYITFNWLAKYKIPIKNMTAYASLGPHLGYIIYSMETSRNLVNGENTQKSYSFLPNEKKINYGSQFAVGGRYKKISVEAFYRSYYKIHYHHFGKRVFNYGLALSVYFQKNKTESK